MSDLDERRDMAITESPEPEGFLNSDAPRRHSESVLVRLIATAGIVGLGTAIAAVLGGLDVASWVAGLVVSVVTLCLAAVLWRSRAL